jgi:hypothetical protein
MGCRRSGASSIVQSPAAGNALAVVDALSVGSMQVEVETPALAADLASLLRRCGYEDAEVRGRFVTVARLNPGLPPLEDLRLAAIIDVWRRRHGGVAAARRR